MDRFEKPFHVTGIHLPARQNLLDRGESEDHPENCRHCPMTHVCLIVKDEVLQAIAFDCHEHHAMGRVDRREDSCRARLQEEGSETAGPDADAAAETAIHVDLGYVDIS